MARVGSLRITFPLGALKRKRTQPRPQEILSIPHAALPDRRRRNGVFISSHEQDALREMCDARSGWGKVAKRLAANEFEQRLRSP